MTPEIDNKLLKRMEISMVVEADACPSFSEAAKIIAEKYKVDASVVAVKKIDGKYGTQQFVVDAHIYPSVEQKALIEPKPKVKKSKEEGK